MYIIKYIDENGQRNELPVMVDTSQEAAEVASELHSNGCRGIRLVGPYPETKVYQAS